MSARVTWDGLTELREALRALPEQLAGEASNIVQASANAAEADIKAAYPVRTGNLRDHLVQSRLDNLGRFGTGVILKNTAKHAWLFENGTQARHTDLGANRGTMPPGRVFVPIVIRRRRAMYAQLKDLLERHGLQVSGDA